MTVKTIYKGLPITIPFVLMLACVLVMQSSIFAENNAVVLAVTIDLLITIPIIYYLLIRKTSIHNTTVIPLVVLGMLVGTYFLPKDSQSYLDLFKTYAFPFFELAVVAFLIVKVRVAVRHFKEKKSVNLDFFTALKTTCYEILPKKIVYPIATEIAVLYYGFFKWKMPPLKKNEFSYHKNSGTPAVLFVFLFVIGIETFAVHLLVSQWNSLFAWLLTGASTYTALQIFGFAKSLAFRPMAIDNNYLYIRYGVLGEVNIPLTKIDAIEPHTNEVEVGPSLKSLSPFYKIEQHNVLLTLKDKQTLISIYGIKHRFEKLAFFVDEPEIFTKSINTKINRV